MTITIENQSPEYGLRAKDVKEGHAYSDKYGRIYIGHRVRTAPYGQVLAFCTDGQRLLYEDDTSTQLREVDLSIKIL